MTNVGPNAYQTHTGCDNSVEEESQPPSQDWLAEQVTEVSAG